MIHLNSVFHSLLFLCLFAAGALAEPVSVNRGNGLGFVFQHRGNCYLILPAHVHGRQTRLSIATAAPSAVGDAQVFRTYAPELDLSIAFVSSGLEQRCADRFDDLRADIQPILDASPQAQLVRVDAAGGETRDDMVITAFDLETITARTVNAGRAEEIYQGTSGGILRSGNTVLGMAIQSPDVQQAIFLRTDEIVARISRQLDARIGPLPGDTNANAPNAAAQCPAGSIAIAAIQCNIEPQAPDLACSNLLSGGPAAFPRSQAQPRIVLSLAGDKAQPLGMVSLASSNTDGATAIPKGILIDISSTDGAPRWRRFGSGDMPPSGRFTATNGATPYARQIAITLQSGWDETLPLRLDCISLQ